MNTKETLGMKRVAAVFALAFGVGACGPNLSDDVMAYAEGSEFTVDEAVELLTEQPQLPANRQVIRALAELWVDYTLLTEAARQDSTLNNVDVDALIAQRIDQNMIRALRGAVIQVDTVLDDDQLRFLYEQDQPGATVSARHILLHFDQTRPQSKAEAIDLANDLRRRLIAGADFSALAREYSKDPSSAETGGDLGSFTRERMVPEFSAAAFELDPGEVSGPVETMYGIHVIRVDSKDVPPFDDLKDRYRNAIKNERIARAESTYVSGIEGPADPQIVDGAYDIARTIGRDPGAPLAGRAASKAIVEYTGGIFSVGEFRAFMQNQSPAYRSQVAEATDQELDVALRGLTRGKLLVEQARAAGLAPEPAAVDSMRAATRVEIADAARRLGVLGAGASDDVQGTIRLALAEMLKGDRDVIPLGQIGYALSEQYTARINDAAVAEASRRVEEARTSVPVAPPSVPGAGEGTSAPDSSSGS